MRRCFPSLIPIHQTLWSSFRSGSTSPPLPNSLTRPSSCSGHPNSKKSRFQQKKILKIPKTQQIPKIPKLKKNSQKTAEDDTSPKTHLTIICDQTKTFSPTLSQVPPSSYASHPSSSLLIIFFEMDKNSEFEIPISRGSGTNRVLYFFEGDFFFISGRKFSVNSGVVLDPKIPVVLKNGGISGQFLLFEGISKKFFFLIFK